MEPDTSEIIENLLKMTIKPRWGDNISSPATRNNFEQGKKVSTETTSGVIRRKGFFYRTACTPLLLRFVARLPRCTYRCKSSTEEERAATKPRWSERQGETFVCRQQCESVQMRGELVSEKAEFSVLLQVTSIDSNKDGTADVKFYMMSADGSVVPADTVAAVFGRLHPSDVSAYLGAQVQKQRSVFARLRFPCLEKSCSSFVRTVPMHNQLFNSLSLHRPVPW